MATLFTRIGSIVGAIMLLALVAAVTPAAAQQPNSVNPTASAVQEDKLLQELRRLQGRISIPDERASVLEQPAGRDWRQFHQVTLHWIGGISILGMLVILVLFYTIRGMIKMSRGRSGRTITRFNGLERFMHWLTAGTFIVLAISGINVTFGKNLLLPLIGPEAFTGFSQWAKYAHSYLSFPFTLGLVFIFFMWIKDNIPNAVDTQWLKEGGGLVGKAHPPAYKFNAGQKIVFWVVALGGAAVAISGYLLMFPFYGTGIVGHADRPSRPRHRRRAHDRRHAGSHLYRHAGHGRRLRSHVHRRGRPALGRGAPQPLGRGGDGEERDRPFGRTPSGRGTHLKPPNLRISRPAPSAPGALL